MISSSTSLGSLRSVPALSVGALDLERMETAILVGGALFFLAVVGLGAYFVVRYRTRPDATAPSDAPARTDSTRLLMVATAAAAALVVVACRVGFAEYVKDTVAPEAALQIYAQKVDASWSFSYANGAAQTDNVFVLPEDRPIAITVSAAPDEDPGSFVVPELRIRQRVAPGSVSTIFFEPRTTGIAHVMGPKGRSVTDLKFVPAAEFDELMRVGPKNPYCASPDFCTPEQKAQWGQDLFAQSGCIACHSRDGTRIVGPTFKGVYGRDETMTTGLVVHIDDAYIRESIRQPQAKIVKGYENVAMPSFATLSDRKVDALVEYLKTVK